MSDGAEIVVTANRAPAASNAASQAPVARPAWAVTLDGQDLSSKLQPYLIMLRISERREDAADQLDIELDDSAGDLDLPPEGAMLTVSLGWEEGPGLMPGLIDKGSFTVDEVSHFGPPDRISIKARSADFTSEWRKKRDQAWIDRTLADILGELAARHRVELKIADEFASLQLENVTQSRESDMALMMRLGKEHDAVATLKAGYLLFIPLAGGKSASGKDMDVVTIRRSDGDGHSYTVAGREDYTGVTAKWHDRKAAEQKTSQSAKPRKEGTEIKKSKAKEKPAATAGSDENAKVLTRIFASEAEANRAAEAEWAKIQRAPRSLRLSLAFGRPELGAAQPVTLVGWRPEISDQNWLIKDVTHSLDPGNGLTSSLDCEVVGG
ncbi:MAG: contractile injection system protein, VgrG/Pvc8 family [Sphingomonadaceae bacterium]